MLIRSENFLQKASKLGAKLSNYSKIPRFILSNYSKIPNFFSPKYSKIPKFISPNYSKIPKFTIVRVKKNEYHLENKTGLILSDKEEAGLNELFDYHLFSTMDIQASLHGLTIETTAVERIPCIDFPIPHWRDDGSGVVAEVQVKVDGLAVVIQALELEDGAEGTDRHVNRRIVEFVVRTEVERQLITAYKLAARERAAENSIVGRDVG